MAKIITLDSLCQYFSERGKTIHFNSEKDGHELFVKTDGKMKFEETNNKGMLKVTLKSCHVGKNLNGSSISYEAMQGALPSFYHRPILGYIHEVDGQYEFKSHEMDIDKDGNIVYEEIPVGVITSKEGSIERDYENDRDYAIVSGVIWEEYTKAAEILKRDRTEDCSIEIKILDMSYDAKEKLLLINSFMFTGVTILGKDENGKEIEPGMSGANISIEDSFAASDGESVPTEFSDNKNLEGRRTTDMATHNLPTEDLENENKNVLFDGDDVGGDTQEPGTGDEAGNEDGQEPDLSNQEPAANEPGDVVEPEQGKEHELDSAPQPTRGGDASPAEEPALRGGDNNGNENEPEQNQSNDEEEQAQSTDDGAADESIRKIKMSIEDKTFELSLTERAYAVEDLVNATYSSEDNDYYFCKVFEDHVIMQPWFGSQCYSQKYSVENDVFSLVGEREKVYAEFLTESERDALNMMRSTYAELKKYKEDSEAEKIRVEKENVFAKFDERLSENSEYISLKENRDQYAASELEEKCNAIVGKQAMQFASNEDNLPAMSTVGVRFEKRDDSKDKRYGNLFN